MIENDHSRFNLLGDFECWNGGRRIHLGGSIQDRLIVTLLLDYNQVVPLHLLMRSAWEDTPPTTAKHQIRKAIATLRRKIPDGMDIIETEANGYRAKISEENLDLGLFNQELRSAQEAYEAGDESQALHKLDRTLKLWRGPVMLGNGGQVIEAASTSMNERRLSAYELYVDIRLRRGEGNLLIGELRREVEQNPLRESLLRYLLISLAKTGRSAEALIEYDRIRRHLGDELGAEPSPQLSAVHTGILQEQPELVSPRPPITPGMTHGPTPRVSPAPATLPRDLDDFTARSRELDQILIPGDQTHLPGTGVIAIDGMGGIGKTALAVHAAHRLSDQYPDGSLFLNLRGLDPVEDPWTTEQALGVLLRSFGALGNPMPKHPEECMTQWRTTTAGRRILLVLDNVASSSQIRHLLPSSQNSLVITTSRARLTDLDGASWLTLDPLAPTESVELITKILDSKTRNNERAAIPEMARLCAHHPLALRLATSRFLNRPGWTLEHFLTRLRNKSARLAELRSGERSVVANLQLSIAAMPPYERRALGVLARHLEPFNAQLASGLLGTTMGRAEAVLENLLENRLLQQQDARLYSFHEFVTLALGTDGAVGFA